MSRCNSTYSLRCARARKGHKNSNRVRTHVFIVLSQLQGAAGWKLRLQPTGLSQLLAGHEVDAAVPLPAVLVGLGALRPLFAVTDRVQLVGRYSHLHEEFLAGGGTAVAETEVVLRGAAFVAVTLKSDLRLWKVAEDVPKSLGVAGQRGPRVLANIELVVVEERVLDLRRQPFAQTLLRRRRWRRWRWRWHGYPDGGGPRLGSTRTLGGQ